MENSAYTHGFITQLQSPKLFREQGVYTWVYNTVAVAQPGEDWGVRGCEMGREGAYTHLNSLEKRAYTHGLILVDTLYPNQEKIGACWRA